VFYDVAAWLEQMVGLSTQEPNNHSNTA
jgi:hypothetical protein